MIGCLSRRLVRFIDKNIYFFNWKGNFQWIFTFHSLFHWIFTFESENSIWSFSQKWCNWEKRWYNWIPPFICLMLCKFWSLERVILCFRHSDFHWSLSFKVQLFRFCTLELHFGITLWKLMWEGTWIIGQGMLQWTPEREGLMLLASAKIGRNVAIQSRKTGW